MLLGSGEGWSVTWLWFTIIFVKAITFEFWLYQLYRQSLKSYLAVLPILIVDHSNTARESGFAIKYGTMPQGMIVMHS